MLGARPWFLALALALLQLASSSLARAQLSEAPNAPPPESSAQGGPLPATFLRGPRLHWNPRWKKVDTEHYVLFGVGISLSLGKFLLGPRGARQHGGVLVDEGARDALRVRALADERLARDASDVLLASALSYPFFDALVVAGWYRQSPEVAQQIALISAEALGVTAGLQAIANVAVSRERPFGRRCGSGKPAEGRDCDSPTRYFSFFSGHASQAFTAAGVTCMHHAYLPLYGGRAPDALICAGGFVAASAAALLRVVGDQHYVSDIVVGAAVGTLSGLGVPWLLHYRHGEAHPPLAERGALRVQLLPTPTGARLVGVFP